MTQLQNRAATALDRTHNPALVLANDPYTVKVRAYLAAWLDGKRMKATFVITCCRWLEMVAA
ncbi:MAG: hypothetical protein ACJ8HI_13740 [Massilia sp.]|jgi:hypothetical protein